MEHEASRASCSLQSYRVRCLFISSGGEDNNKNREGGREGESERETERDRERQREKKIQERGVEKKKKKANTIDRLHITIGLVTRQPSRRSPSTSQTKSNQQLYISYCRVIAVTIF